MIGKVALITDGTSGIGKATAQAFVRAGAKVVICGRNQERGQEVVGELKAMNGDALFVAADDPHHFEAMSDDFVTWVVFWGPKGGER